MRLTPGARLGPYEILAPLAAGGMGEVYRARDPRLGRDVAVKVLPEARGEDPERLRRFRQEARAAGRLNHPNVLTVYDVGEDGAVLYLVTELLEGETLRGRLEGGRLQPEETLDIALQVCRGLGAAHAAGILHRDLKPENIFVTRERGVKLLDFGLAKLVFSAVADHDRTTLLDADATRAGLVLGTVGYMAPEQVRGEAVDARTDLFAFGAVLLEMITGRRAFARPTAAETLAAILRDEPDEAEPAAVADAATRQLERVARRCLAKDPSARFERVSDVEEKLTVARGSSAGSTAAAVRGGHAVWTLAVLPFRELGGESDNPHLSVGLADAIITELAAQRMLTVRPTSAILRYRAEPPGPQVAARDLGVDAVVEGSFQRAGDRLRVTVQLVAAREERPLWGDKIDTTLDDVFRLQDEIARRVTRALVGELASAVPAVAAGAGPTGRAYELFLKGRLHLLTETLANTRQAVEELRQATAADPDFALAWAGLADAYVSMSVEFEPEGDWWGRGRAACERALAIDPNLPEGRYVRARLLWSREGQFDNAGAMRELAFAVTRRPSLNEGFHRLGTLLCHVSLLEESSRAFERAAAINPEDLSSLLIFGYCRYLQRRTDEALRLTADVQRAAPSAWAAYQKALCHVQELDWGEAAAAVEQGRRAFPRAVLFGPLQAVFAARRGDEPAARRLIAETQQNQRAFNHFHHALYDCACAYAALGEGETAIEWLEAAARSGFPCVDFIRRDALLEPLRGAARFDRLLGDLEAEKVRYARLFAELGLAATLRPAAGT